MHVLADKVHKQETVSLEDKVHRQARSDITQHGNILHRHHHISNSDIIVGTYIECKLLLLIKYM